MARDFVAFEHLGPLLSGRESAAVLVWRPQSPVAGRTQADDLALTATADLRIPEALNLSVGGHSYFVAAGSRGALLALAERWQAPGARVQVIDSQVTNALAQIDFSVLTYLHRFDSANLGANPAADELLENLAAKPERGAFLFDDQLDDVLYLFSTLALQPVLELRELRAKLSIQLQGANFDANLAEVIQHFATGFRGTPAFAVHYRNTYILNSHAAQSVMDLKGELAPPRAARSVDVPLNLAKSIRHCLREVAAVADKACEVETVSTETIAAAETAGHTAEILTPSVPAAPVEVPAPQPVSAGALAELANRFGRVKTSVPEPLVEPVPKRSASAPKRPKSAKAMPLPVKSVAALPPQSIVTEPVGRALRLIEAQVQALGLDSSALSSVHRDSDLRLRLRIAKLYPELREALDASHGEIEAYAAAEDPSLREEIERTHQGTSLRIQAAYNAILESISERSAESSAVVVEITPPPDTVVNGDDFTMLTEMYQNLSARMGWKLTVTDTSENANGLNHVVMRVEGVDAAELLGSERGRHRVFAFYDKSKEARRAVDINVYREAAKHEIDVKPSDLEISAFRARGPGGQHVNFTDSAVRIRHIPSDISVRVESERSQGRNREIALAQIRGRLIEARDKASRQRRDEQRRTFLTDATEAFVRTYDMRGHQVATYAVVHENGLREALEAARRETRIAELLRLGGT